MVINTMKNTLTHHMPPAKQETTDFTKNGHCSRCGACCTHHLRMAPMEVTRIKEYIQKHHIKPCTHNNNGGPSIDFLCPFLDTSKQHCSCTIYPVRPVICQTFKCNQSEQETVKQLRNILDQNRALAMQFLNGFDYNLGQTFFPDIYQPKKDDYVIFNQVDLKKYEKYQGQIFQVTEVQDIGESAWIVSLSDTNTKIYTFLANLTKIQ